MKPILSLASCLCLVFAGCGEKPAAALKSEPATDAASAPADYLKSAAKAQKSAVKAVDTAALNKAVELFYVQEGRFPKDLGEVVEKKFIPELPPTPAGMKLSYDAQDGVVRVEKE